MKNMLLAVLMLITTAVFGQNIPQTQVTVPQDQIVAESKVFLGTWNAVSCQTDGNVGLQFQIRQGTGDDIRPQASLKQTFAPNQPVTPVDYPFTTRAFLKFTSTQEPITLLEITNNVVYLSLTPKKNGTLYGLAYIPATEDEFQVLFAPANYSLDVFYSNTIGACTDETRQREFFDESSK